jgi:hypothetical protein
LFRQIYAAIARTSRGEARKLLVALSFMGDGLLPLHLLIKPVVGMGMLSGLGLAARAGQAKIRPGAGCTLLRFSWAWRLCSGDSGARFAAGLLRACLCEPFEKLDTRLQQAKPVRRVAITPLGEVNSARPGSQNSFKCT